MACERFTQFIYRRNTGHSSCDICGGFVARNFENAMVEIENVLRQFYKIPETTARKYRER
jgi:hypothetical protein